MICTRTLYLTIINIKILKYTHIVRPVGVIKVETFHSVLSIRTLGVCNTCNISGQSCYFATYVDLRVVAPSI